MAENKPTRGKPEPHELLGFLLGQDRSAFEKKLGKPFHQEKIEDGRIAYAYHIAGAPQSYFVALYGKDGAIRLELTGTDYAGPTGFLGLKLGDSAAKVESMLGKPSEIRHEGDVNVDLWDYKDDNFSLEFSADHILYSIQIVKTDWAALHVFAGSKDVGEFANAVQSRDIDRVMSMISGQMYCSKGKEFFEMKDGPARELLQDEHSKISVCLKLASEAVLTLGPEMKGADDQMRMWTEANPGAVTKLPATSALQEIVFVIEERGWRIYEVTLR